MSKEFFLIQFNNDMVIKVENYVSLKYGCKHVWIGVQELLEGKLSIVIRLLPT